MKASALLAGLPLVAFAACGTPPPSWAPDAGACTPYMSPAGTDLTMPTVSFQTDVMPVFTNNCSSAICHGSGSKQGNLFLGDHPMKGSDPTAVYKLITGKSAELTSMPFVTPNDLSNSYLMHKLDGDQCMFQSACVSSDCKNVMPYDAPALPVETRDIVRRWIAQGAAQN